MMIHLYHLEMLILQLFVSLNKAFRTMLIVIYSQHEKIPSEALQPQQVGNY